MKTNEPTTTTGTPETRAAATRTAATRTAATRTAAAGATRRAAPANPRTRHQEAVRGKRVVVKGGTRRRTGPAPDRPLRLALWTTAVLTVATIFGAAFFHVLLVQSQFRLDRVDKRAQEQQQRYEHLRLEVARLSAPERIVATAQERLGMVVPPQVGYLMAPGPIPGDATANSLAGQWTEVKPYLVARP